MFSKLTMKKQRQNRKIKIIFNEDGKISYFSDWFDVNGIQVQIEAE